jgi:hypothetical protein
MNMKVICWEISKCCYRQQLLCRTFIPYWSFATIGLSEMNVKSLRRQVNGRGTIRAQKMSISVTRRRKT